MTSDPAALFAYLRSRHWSLVTAESLTGGLLADAIVSVAGASDVFAGGVVTYSVQSKARLLGVDADLLRRSGPVDARVAEQMAAGVRELFGDASNRATIGVSTTGVAGPGPSDGHEAGTVFVGLSTPWGSEALSLRLGGDRQRVRRDTVAQSLAWVSERLRQAHT